MPMICRRSQNKPTRLTEALAIELHGQGAGAAANSVRLVNTGRYAHSVCVVGSRRSNYRLSQNVFENLKSASENSVSGGV